MTREEITLIDTQDGSHSLLSKKFGVSYHSKYGAIQETKHVFLEAGLSELLLQKKPIAVLEYGFGTGLNAFMTFLKAQSTQVLIDYHTIEAFPVEAQLVRQFNYTDLLTAKEYQSVFYQLHESKWDTLVKITPNFHFTKHLKKFEEVEFEDKFNLIYFDAFAPSAQPELWETEVLQKAYNALTTGGTFVTYCAKGQVKRNLKEIGFEVKALPGPPGKREMTKGIKI